MELMNNEAIGKEVITDIQDDIICFGFYNEADWEQDFGEYPDTKPYFIASNGIKIINW